MSMIDSEVLKDKITVKWDSIDHLTLKDCYLYIAAVCP
jgi:hypothetical protein